MKSKRFLCIALAVLTALTLCACGRNGGEPAASIEPEAAATAEPTAAQEPSPTARITEQPTATKDPADGTSAPGYDLDIPIYSADRMFDEPYTNIDYCKQDDTDVLFHSWPGFMDGWDMHTEATRIMYNGDEYAIVGFDNGYRLYVIYGGRTLGEKSEQKLVRGLPILLKEILSYSDYAHLKVGDPIELVAEISPLAEKLMELENGGIPPETFHRDAEHGWGFSTLHYLSDGILRIVYDMDENRQFFIYSIEYSEDYKLTSSNGRVVCYKLFDIDLPPQ